MRRVGGAFTPHGGEPHGVVEWHNRRAPAHDRLDRCVFVQELTDEYGTVFSFGEALISYPPR